MKGNYVPLESLMVRRGGSVDPAKFKDEEFDLYSIPAFDRGGSELVFGRDIGSSKQVLETGDVLLSKIVPHIRRAWVVGAFRQRRIIGSGEWIVFRAAKSANPRYLSHVLVGDPFHSQFMQTVSGVGGSLLRARPAQVAKIEIPLPPLAEQKRIAAILDAADALRAKRREAIAQLDALLQSSFLTLFGDPVSNPMGWPVSRLGDVFDLKHGFAFKSEDFAEEGKYVLLTPGNFYEKGGFRDRGERQRYHDDPVPEDYILQKMDLLVAMTEQAPGLLGSPILVPESGRFLHNQRLGKLVKRAEVESLYVFELLNSHSIRARIQKDSTGTKVKHTSPTKITQIEIGMPPLPLQQKFAAIVESIERQKTTQRAHLAELDALFAALQHRAFRGEL